MALFVQLSLQLTNVLAIDWASQEAGPKWTHLCTGTRSRKFTYVLVGQTHGSEFRRWGQSPKWTHLRVETRSRKFTYFLVGETHGGEFGAIASCGLLAGLCHGCHLLVV